MKIGGTEVTIEEYFYCELCWTYKDRPAEPVLCFPYRDGRYDAKIMYICKDCLVKCLTLFDTEV